MIVKHPLPEDPTPGDAPPSYDTIGAPNTDYHHEKSPLPDNLPSTSSVQLTPTPSQPLKSPSPSTKGKARANWFTFTTSRTAREVRTTVLGLVRDLVREHSSDSPASLGILQSCAEACASQSVSLSSILQEKSIENHTPIYWAIVRRAPDEIANETAHGADLLSALLSYSTPLTHGTISEIRSACLATSDQRLFQRLRMSPEFASISGSDQMLLGATLPPDDIHVDDVPGDEGAFAVEFGIVRFQKRMMVTKEISLEFIARARMWQLKFFVVTDTQSNLRPGSWCVSLSLVENSPPTWIDSRLMIEEPSDQPYTSLIDMDEPKNTTRNKPRPTISLRLKSGLQLVNRDQRNSGNGTAEIVAPFEESLKGSSLQYAGTSYIARDEVLRARLEAKLAKPEGDCVIC